MYGDMGDVDEDVVSVLQEHMRQDELWRRKYGQLDTQTRNVSNQ